MIKQAKMDLGIPYQELKIQRLAGDSFRIFFDTCHMHSTDFKRAAHWIRSNEEPTDLGELNKRWLYLILDVLSARSNACPFTKVPTSVLDIVESYIP
jgi:hypothetical protein